jgi:hypothetical protein
MTRAALAAVALAAACSAETVLAPVIDVPAAGSPAYPWTDLDGLTLQVTHQGDPGILSEKSFTRGQAPALDVGFGDDLVVHLTGTRAGVEFAYGRSCPVTVQAERPIPAAPHLYFARIVRWAAGPRPAAPARTGGAAWTAPDGSGLFAGGDGGETSIERFDTASGAFVPVAGASAARPGAAIAPLPDGSALRVGGDAPEGILELLSPLATTATVQRIDDARLRLVEHAAATLVDGSVVVIGGRTPGAGLATTGVTFSLGRGDAGAPAAPRLMSAALTTPRAGHTLTRLGDEVGAALLVIGGRDAAGAPVAAAEMWEPLSEAYADFHPAMKRPRYGHRAERLPDGSILVVGGRGPGGVPEATIEVYRPRLGQFDTAGTLPAGAGLTELSVTALPDGRVLLAGGRDRDERPVATTLIAQPSPSAGAVVISPTDPLAAPRAGHAATLLCDGTVLLVGGTSDAAAPGAERYNPSSAGRR